MNPEVKPKWIAMLRSGKYRQGYSALRNSNDEFCCLGVLCELAVEEGIIGPPTSRKLENTYYSFGNKEQGNFGTLPPEVVEWAGIDCVGTIAQKQTSLAWLNDGLEYTFERIADVIEEHF